MRARGVAAQSFITTSYEEESQGGRSWQQWSVLHFRTSIDCMRQEICESTNTDETNAACNNVDNVFFSFESASVDETFLLKKSPLQRKRRSGNLDGFQVTIMDVLKILKYHSTYHFKRFPVVCETEKWADVIMVNWKLPGLPQWTNAC